MLDDHQFPVIILAHSLRAIIIFSIVYSQANFIGLVLKHIEINLDDKLYSFYKCVCSEF